MRSSELDKVGRVGRRLPDQPRKSPFQSPYLMARSPIGVRPLALCEGPLPPLLDLGPEQLNRMRRQEQAIKQALVWDSASRNATTWSLKWTWEYSPHVIELGEDLLNLSLREADESSLLQLCAVTRTSNKDARHTDPASHLAHTYTFCAPAPA